MAANTLDGWSRYDVSENYCVRTPDHLTNTRYPPAVSHCVGGALCCACIFFVMIFFFFFSVPIVLLWKWATSCTHTHTHIRRRHILLFRTRFFLLLQPRHPYLFCLLTSHMSRTIMLRADDNAVHCGTVIRVGNNIINMCVLYAYTAWSLHFILNKNEKTSGDRLNFFSFDRYSKAVQIFIRTRISLGKLVMTGRTRYGRRLLRLFVIIIIIIREDWADRWNLCGFLNVWYPFL